MGIAVILYISIEEIVNNPSTEGPIWNLVKIGQAVSENENTICTYLFATLIIDSTVSI